LKLSVAKLNTFAMIMRMNVLLLRVMQAMCIIH